MTSLKKIESRLTEVADVASWASRLHTIIKLCTRDVCRKLAVGKLDSGASYAIWLVDEFWLYSGMAASSSGDHIKPLYKLLQAFKLDLTVVNIGVKLYVVVTDDSAWVNAETLPNILKKIIPIAPRD